MHRLRWGQPRNFMQSRLYLVLILLATALPGISQSTAGKQTSLVDSAGPDVSLQNSEALFYIAATLNSCGYDQGLDASDPLRQEVRALVNQAIQASEAARVDHEAVCNFMVQHRLTDSGADLAQYIS